MLEFFQCCLQVKIKVGIGYDIHRLVPGRKLILGGVMIDFHKGLLGHSDADVLIHAIADALLGALGLPNIGQVFPDTETWTQGLDSKKILKYAQGMIDRMGYKISNIDVVIIAQEPKLSPYLDKIRKSIASILLINMEDIGLKAATNEWLGPIGSGESIASIANTILISDKYPKP
ncbi:MAG: 2-C-methyl-D-erythritol 2,4-cyclodiphosphate synthase [Puniceicoccales bacterium]|jgi:2-C-methyl-D-erythritol 2,4-cyclodiphosphate synthase|nr:2-C-methyl-D-erythritol 2,4-cyclodiphosphate synthase [Puniceicoccales bacterium]